MHTLSTARMLPMLALLALASCGNSGPDTGRHEGSTAQAQAGGMPSSSSSLAGDQLEVTVEGTPFAGVHRAAGNMTCMMYGGTWQAVHEDMNATGLSAMLVQLKGIPATGGDTDQLTFTLTFGQMDDMSGTAGMIDLVGSEFGGDARATVTREGGGATLRVEGTPVQGGKVTATLRCAEVDLMR